MVVTCHILTRFGTRLTWPIRYFIIVSQMRKLRLKEFTGALPLWLSWPRALVWLTLPLQGLVSVFTDWALGRSRDRTCIPAFSGPFQRSVCTKYMIVDWTNAWFHPTDSYCSHSTDNAWHPPTIIWESQHVTPQKKPRPVRGISAGSRCGVTVQSPC